MCVLPQDAVAIPLPAEAASVFSVFGLTIERLTGSFHLILILLAFFIAIS